MNHRSPALAICLSAALLAFPSSAGASKVAEGGEGRIAFVARTDTNDDIYTVDADGTDVVRLTDHPAFDVDPTFSPDGREIAFISNRDGYLHFDLYLMKADGGDVRQLTDGATAPFENAAVFEPAFSPDGRRIAFSANFDGYWDIYSVRTDGSHLKRLTRSDQFDGYPSFSPDGKSIVFMSERDSGEGDIYVMNAHGHHVRRLTFTPALFDAEPTFGADGSTVVFVSEGEDHSLDLYMMNTDGSALTQLTSDPATEFSPDVSPDGSRIVFSRDGQVWVMDADGTDPMLLSAERADDASPSWAGAGRQHPRGRQNGSAH